MGSAGCEESLWSAERNGEYMHDWIADLCGKNGEQLIQRAAKRKFPGAGFPEPETPNDHVNIVFVWLIPGYQMYIHQLVTSHY